MKKLKIISVLLCVVMLAGMLSGCTTLDNFIETFSGTKTQSSTVKIGIFEPQTGEDKDYGELEIRGFELAHEMYPSVLGKDVEFIYEDTQSSIYVAETAIQNLISYEPSVILGPYGEANALTSSDYIEEAKIPSIVVSNKNNLITLNNKYYFRMSFIDAFQGKALANYVGKATNAKRIAILRKENDDTTTEVTNKFIAQLKKLYKKNPVVTKQISKIGSTDYTDNLQVIMAQNVDTVFAPIDSKEADALFKQVEKLGLSRSLTFVGTTNWYNQDFLTMMKKHPRINVVLATDFNSNKNTTEMTETFISMYKAKYGDDQVPTEATALAFDAYVLAIKSIEKAGDTNGDKIKDVMSKTKNFQGASGELSFDANGNPKKTIIIDTIQNGVFTPVYTVN